MSKFPREGQVKTRMIPDIGAEKATAVHKGMAEHCVRTIRAFSQNSSDNPTKAIVHIANAELDEAEQWLGEGHYVLQKGSDLGERMAHAIQASIDQASDKILVIGTDCPTLTEKEFQQAFDALDEYDTVFSPAKDGGYVMIGMKHLQQAAFQNIDWGSETVLSQSLQNLDSSKVSYKLLEVMEDVDFAKDVPQSFL